MRYALGRHISVDDDRRLSRILRAFAVAKKRPFLKVDQRCPFTPSIYTRPHCIRICKVCIGQNAKPQFGRSTVSFPCVQFSFPYLIFSPSPSNSLLPLLHPPFLYPYPLSILLLIPFFPSASARGSGSTVSSPPLPRVVGYRLPYNEYYYYYHMTE